MKKIFAFVFRIDSHYIDYFLDNFFIIWPVRCDNILETIL